MVLRKLNILERAVHDLVILVQHADAEENYAGKVAVALDILEVGAVKLDFVMLHQLRVGGEEHVVCRTLAHRAKLIRCILLENQLAGAEIRPAVALIIAPALRIFAVKESLGILNERIIKLHTLEYLVYLLAIEYQVDLLVGPAEELLVKVPEIYDKQDTDSDEKRLYQFLEEFAHIRNMLLSLYGHMPEPAGSGHMPVE